MKAKKKIPVYEIMDSDFLEKMNTLADIFEADFTIKSGNYLASYSSEEVKKGYKQQINNKMKKEAKSRFENQAAEKELSKGFFSFEPGECVVFTDLEKGTMKQDDKVKTIFKARHEETGEIWTFPTHIKLSMKLENLHEMFGGDNNPFEVTLLGIEPVENDPKKKNYLYRVRY